MSLKFCKTCERALERTAFSSGRHECKECRAAMARLTGRTIWKAPVTEKYCGCCDRTRSVDCFNRHPANPDGLGTRCRDCLAVGALPSHNDPEAKRNRKWQQLLNNVPAFKRGNIGPLVFGVAA